MNRIPICMLSAVAVAACVSPGSRPTPPIASELATAPSPASTMNELNSPPPPPATPSVAPAPTQPAVLDTSVVATKNGIRLSLRAAEVPFRPEQPVNVTMRIENRSAKSVWWIAGCDVPGLVYVHLNSEAWIGGRSQTGIAAAFKAFALEPFGHAGSSPLAIGLPSGTSGCGDTGFTFELEPGREMDRTARWTGTSDTPIPNGPADLVGAFEFYPTSELDGSAGTEVEVRLPTWISSDQVVDFIPPGPAIDIALADQTFAAWLADAPTSGWINSTHTLDRDGGTWEIGLFRAGPGGAAVFASVTFDAGTGQILDHRFG
ncbi:MAG TPA: hypothetical protein VFP56_04815 [Candidatus Limnocylindrales bacterium]|nr:hypothetical protein [Candidatus Limnocylindrales bacterium]